MMARRALCYMGYGDDAHYALAEKDLQTMVEVNENKGDAYCYMAQYISLRKQTMFLIKNRTQQVIGKA